MKIFNYPVNLDKYQNIKSIQEKIKGVNTVPNNGIKLSGIISKKKKNLEDKIETEIKTINEIDSLINNAEILINKEKDTKFEESWFTKNAKMMVNNLNTLVNDSLNDVISQNYTSSEKMYNQLILFFKKKVNGMFSSIDGKTFSGIWNDPMDNSESKSFWQKNLELWKECCFKCCTYCSYGVKIVFIYFIYVIETPYNCNIYMAIYK
jgi:hypothetical protein